MKNTPKEIKELEYLRNSGIMVTNKEISEQSINLPTDVYLSIDDKFDLCVLLAMKLKEKNAASKIQ